MTNFRLKREEIWFPTSFAFQDLWYIWLQYAVSHVIFQVSNRKIATSVTPLLSYDISREIWYRPLTLRYGFLQSDWGSLLFFVLPSLHNYLSTQADTVSPTGSAVPRKWDPSHSCIQLNAAFFLRVIVPYSNRVQRIFLIYVMLKRCQTNIYLHKILLKLLSILISMIGSINTPSLIRKAYNIAARIISPLSLLKHSIFCLVNFFLSATAQ